MKSKKVIVVILAAIILISGVSFFLLRPSSDESSAASLYVPEEPGIAVEAALAGYGMVIPSVNSSGLVRGKNEAVIISETRGVIVEVYNKIGTYMEKGAPVLSVDSNIAELSKLQAEQQYRSAQIDYEAVKRAYEKGSASEAEILRVQGQLAGAEALYKASVNSFENSVIKVPFSGFLADIDSSLSVGNYISEGVRIGKVIDLSSIKVDLFLGDDEVSKIKQGASATIDAGGKTLKGRVEAIALSSDKSTGSFRVIVSAVNPYGAEMRSGFAADVSINEVDSDESIIIPASAVFELGGEDWVYKIEDNKASLVKVETGAVSGNRMEILTGLNEGDAVIISGFKSMSDGAQVIPRFITRIGEAQ